MTEDTTEQVVALLRETADKLENDEAVLSRADYKNGIMNDTSRLDIEFWDKE